MRAPKVFVDTDVVISSLLSNRGAAYFLLDKQADKSIISNISKVELERVAARLEIDKERLKDLIKSKFEVVKLNVNLAKIKRDFRNYTSDPNDAHIVAGAKQVKAKFLLTYNTRHFKREKIRDDFKIIVVTPAQHLQYLRSLE